MHIEGLDELDNKILNAIRDNARLSYSDIGEVVETLAKDRFIRQIYSTTGECRLHATGFVPNPRTLESHINCLFRNTKGMKKMSWHLLLSTIKDVDGGVKYEGNSL